MKMSTRRLVREQIQSYGSGNAVVAAALEILRGKLVARRALTSPALVRDFLALNLQPLEHEVFWCVFLVSGDSVN